MPIYEFKCNNCGNLFEELCPMGSQGEGVKCPVCESEDVTKQFSSFASQVKGSSSSSSASSCPTCSTCSTGMCGL